MTVHQVPLGSFCLTGSGTTPARGNADRYYRGNIPWVKSGELRESEIKVTEETVTEEALRETALKLVPAGALLLAMYGANVGRVGILKVPATTNQAVCHIIPDPNRADVGYMFHALCSIAPYFISRGAGGAQPNINQGIVQSAPIYLPSLGEQRRIAAILDQADALRRMRREALSATRKMTQVLFQRTFGDPALNSKAWPKKALGALSTVFSDGPFGSNLKSEHYVDQGVRVIRLQNIGVDEFLSDNAAFVSEGHFSTLGKHRCLPGDILIGTLGDPNLRACILPDEIPFALNKADCVQMRCDQSQVTRQYVLALLNCPSTEQMAQDKIVGQTRLRISMGRLRTLEVPVPPLKLQQEFAKSIGLVKGSTLRQVEQLSRLDALFSSLQHRGFNGELTARAAKRELAEVG